MIAAGSPSANRPTIAASPSARSGRTGRRTADRATIALVGWFGSRGLASVVFALLVLEDLGSPVASHAVAVITITMLLSVIAHGATADPLAARYAKLPARPAGVRVGTLMPEMPERRLIRRTASRGRTRPTHPQEGEESLPRRRQDQILSHDQRHQDQGRERLRCMDHMSITIFVAIPVSATP